MVARQLTHLARLGVVVTAWLGLASGACSPARAPSQPPASAPSLTSAGGEGAIFRFAPPDGTEFVRYDRHKEEHSIVGAPVRSLDEDELQWHVAIRRDGDQYRVKQDLVHVAFKRDGEVLADTDINVDAKQGISAELIIARDGKLVRVGGLDKTAQRLRELAAPGHEEALANVLTPEYLKDVVAKRYRVLFGETIGQPAAPGSSWTITNPPGSFIASRKVTVERHEPCGGTTCARLRVDFTMDPHVVTGGAVALVRSRVESMGGDPSKVTVRNASYAMSGSMLVEPATMLSHGASLAEHASVTIAGTSQEQLTVEAKGTTEISYAYGPQHVAVGDAAQ